MFCSYSPVYRDASGFAIAFSGDRRFRSPSPKTNQGRIAKCAQKPVTIRRGGARPSRQQKTRIKKMFGDFADCANSPNIFSHMAWPRREGTRPSPTPRPRFSRFSVFCNKPFTSSRRPASAPGGAGPLRSWAGCLRPGSGPTWSSRDRPARTPARQRARCCGSGARRRAAGPR